jgi:hypothetical protein
MRLLVDTSQVRFTTSHESCRNRPPAPLLEGPFHLINPPVIPTYRRHQVPPEIAPEAGWAYAARREAAIAR